MYNNNDLILITSYLCLNERLGEVNGLYPEKLFVFSGTKHTDTPLSHDGNKDRYNFLYSPNKICIILT